MPKEKSRGFGDYVLKRLLGHGGMGAVYLAEEKSNGRQVALKILSGSMATNGEYTRRFLTEARLATQLNHPNIVNVWDYGQEENHYYLAMEYVDGLSCKAKIGQDGPLDWPRAIEIALQVAEGLEAAAERGIIHRDIKPENILLDGENRARITDLGLAKEEGIIEPLPSDTSLGTPDYMSPEQVANSETVDFRSDIYSLGATLFHLVCGKAPYTGRSAYEVMVKHVSAPLPSPLKYVPDLPPEVRDVMRKMMARDAEDRYQSYPELIADLKALLAGEAVTASQFDDASMLGVNGNEANGNGAMAGPVGATGQNRTLWAVVAALPILGGIGVLLYLLLSR